MTRRPAVAPAFLFCRCLAARAFIAHSQNKVGGTGNAREHRAIRFVVGAGNADTCEEIFDD
jgi:hypothetical protein